MTTTLCVVHLITREERKKEKKNINKTEEELRPPVGTINVGTNEQQHKPAA